MNLLGRFVDMSDEPDFPVKIHCVLVADLEGASEALFHLKNAGFRGSVEMKGDKPGVG